jgi:hypothetical protein
MPFPCSWYLSCDDKHCFSLSPRDSSSIVVFTVADSGTAVSEPGRVTGLSTDVTVVRREPRWLGPLPVCPSMRPVHVPTMPHPFGTAPAAPLYLPKGKVKLTYWHLGSMANILSCGTEIWESVAAVIAKLSCCKETHSLQQYHLVGHNFM